MTPTDVFRGWFLGGMSFGVLLSGAAVWAVLSVAWNGGHAW